MKEGIYLCFSYLSVIRQRSLDYNRPFIWENCSFKACTFSFFPLRQSDFRLYTYGNDLYDALFTDIKQAKHHVHVLFFIVKNDDISRTFLKLLIDKAQEGIEVRLLLDRFGSHYLSKEAIYSLQKHGVSFILS